LISSGGKPARSLFRGSAVLVVMDCPQGFTSSVGEASAEGCPVRSQTQNVEGLLFQCTLNQADNHNVL
jgi:hypothetical protein